MSELVPPRLHVVTDDAVLAGERWTDHALEVLEAGGPRLALHLRGAATSARTLFDLATALTPQARRAGGALILNDRVDVALAADADGAHLGGGSLSVADARALLGPSRWVGVSRHGADEAAAAATSGADWVFLGTIFTTPSHPGRPPLGVEAVSAAVRRSSALRVVGIGGVGPTDVEALLAAGAWGVAVIRGVWAAPDPARAVSLYLESLGP